MSKLRANINKTNIILALIVLILIIVNLVLYSKKIIQPQQVQKQSNISTNSFKKEKEQTVTVPTTEDEVKNYLSTLSERERIEYYCGQYFRHIANREFKEAYDLLYDEFKQNYFSTFDEYKAYVERTYPEFLGLNYNDITRQGTIYVLKLDVVVDKQNGVKTQRIVIQENDYNDYVLSFQVI